MRLDPAGIIGFLILRQKTPNRYRRVAWNILFEISAPKHIKHKLESVFLTNKVRITSL